MSLYKNEEAQYKCLTQLCSEVKMIRRMNEIFDKLSCDTVISVRNFSFQNTFLQRKCLTEKHSYKVIVIVD
jgi:hypothetical protein